MSWEQPGVLQAAQPRRGANGRRLALGEEVAQPVEFARAHRAPAGRSLGRRRHVLATAAPASRPPGPTCSCCARPRSTWSPTRSRPPSASRSSTSPTSSAAGARPGRADGGRAARHAGSRWSRPFFSDRLASHGLHVVVPASGPHDAIDRIIYDELVHGKVARRLAGDRRRHHGRALGRGRPGRHPRLHRARAAGQAGRLRPLVFPSTTLHVEAALDRALVDDRPPADRACRDHSRSDLDKLDQPGSKSISRR